MKTNFKQQTAKLKRYQKQINNILAKYRDINMQSKELLRDITNLHDLMNQVIYEKVDADYCKSKDPDKMCSDCDCWKHFRMMCS